MQVLSQNILSLKVHAWHIVAPICLIFNVEGAFLYQLSKMALLKRKKAHVFETLEPNIDIYPNFQIHDTSHAIKKHTHKKQW